MIRKIWEIFKYQSVNYILLRISYSTGCLKKSRHSWETKTLGTSFSETTNMLAIEIWHKGVLMSTPCCQSLRSNSLVVSEYEIQIYESVNSEFW